MNVLLNQLEALIEGNSVDVSAYERIAEQAQPVKYAIIRGHYDRGMILTHEYIERLTNVSYDALHLL